MGLSERDGGSLYIAQWIIGPDGETVARRRKLKVSTHVERTVFGEGDGSDLAVHATDIGRLGALCCWEHLQPLSKYAMYSQNEQVHVGAWPSFSVYDPFAFALGAQVNNAASQVYAVEGSCFVIAPCATVSPVMIEELCDTPEKHSMLHAGGGFTKIYGPDGSDLSAHAVGPDEEGIVYADIDLGVISIAKAAADPAGHYARPDVHSPAAQQACRARRRDDGHVSGCRLCAERRSRPNRPPKEIEMESAIATHLRCPRTLQRRVDDDFAPPYPCWTARAGTDVQQVVMACLGVQSKGLEMQGKACAALMAITRTLGLSDGPGHFDTAHYVDEAGYDNMVAIAYWDRPGDP